MSTLDYFFTHGVNVKIHSSVWSFLKYFSCTFFNTIQSNIKLIIVNNVKVFLKVQYMVFHDEIKNVKAKVLMKITWLEL